jgi:plastocyanin
MRQNEKHVSVHRRAIVGLSSLGLVFGLAACGGSDDKSAAPVTGLSDSSAPATEGGKGVKIHTFAFQPNPVQVQAGEMVTWTNDDQILHTVTSGTRGKSDGMFDQKLEGAGSKAMFTFNTAGTFAYHCEIHPGMDATVVVS